MCYNVFESLSNLFTSAIVKYANIIEQNVYKNLKPAKIINDEAQIKNGINGVTIATFYPSGNV